MNDRSFHWPVFILTGSSQQSMGKNLIVNAFGCLDEQTFVPGSEYIGGLLNNQVLYVTEVAVFRDLARIV